MRKRTALIAAPVALAVLGTTGAAVAAGTGKDLDERAARALAAFTAPAADSSVARPAEVRDVGQNTVRVSGADRYATAVEVSRTWDPADVGVVYLATGEGFADALAVGASTGGAGPLLLTGRDRLPAVVAEELQRLQPCTVVVVGGANAVSDAVALEADRYTDPTGCQDPSIP
ncbi:putative cell wall binding repeat protein [Kineococcus xinjiangensis]|uniref:Putative cell wall binding repeat protein n=1 Tax=Kineococcus xinjiangensis TaxID=512762 RepID=A0A2S6ITM5_9ACTN|nr:cell wall-binding repeat-containing protein [Kineococcus xinjiangensis]PPK97602.1 putative cell wall binding repeat protein [Kineococcus xinjiangensis]